MLRQARDIPGPDGKMVPPPQLPETQEVTDIPSNDLEVTGSLIEVGNLLRSNSIGYRTNAALASLGGTRFH